MASFACPTREILSSRFTEDPGAGLTSVTIAESSLEPAILLMLNPKFPNASLASLIVIPTTLGISTMVDFVSLIVISTVAFLEALPPGCKP